MESILFRQCRSTWIKPIFLIVLMSVTGLGCGSAVKSRGDLNVPRTAVRKVPLGKWNCVEVLVPDAKGDHFAMSQIDFETNSMVWEEHGIPYRMDAQWNLKTTPASLQLTSPKNALIRYAILAKTSRDQLRVAVRTDCIPTDFNDPAAVQLRFTPVTKAKPAVVFLVHGSFDGVSDWDRLIPDKVTFASELQSAFGDVKCEIVPSTWSGLLEHQDRIKAASALAKQIDSPEYRGHQVFVVAHSHGGNIALAACGRVKRQVDAVVCLATPHIHLTMLRDNEEPFLVPVYYSPAAREKIGRVLCIMPQGDSVVDTIAQFVPGITTQEALDETEAWRKETNHPRFQDGHKVHREVLRRLLGIGREHDLVLTGTLTSADHNLTVSSEVSGLECHKAIHSRRVGRLLGSWFRSTNRGQAANYLGRLVLPPDAGDGTSVSPEAHQQWLDGHREGLESSGWILTQADVTGVSEKVVRSGGEPDVWDRLAPNQFAAPDMFMAIVDEQGSAVAISDTCQDQFQASFSPYTHLGQSRIARCRVLDRDILSSELMGEFSIDLPDPRVAQLPISELKHEAFHLKLDWQKGHY